MKNNAVRYGLYLGLASILYLFAAYLINTDLLFNAKLNWIPGLVLSLIFMFLACTAERNLNHGSLNFGEAFKTAFLTFAIGTFISVLGSWLLYNVVDTSLIETGKEYAIEMQRSMAERFGANEEAIAAMEAQAEEMDNPFSLSTSMMGYFFSLFIGAIISAIIGAITKRNTGA